MNNSNIQKKQKKYYEFEGGYITYNPKNMTEKYLSNEYRDKMKIVL